MDVAGGNFKNKAKAKYPHLPVHKYWVTNGGSQARTGGRREDRGRSLSLTHRRDEGGDIAASFQAIRGPRPPRDPDTVQAVHGCHILQGRRRQR